MTKIFDPKITKGPWKLSNGYIVSAKNKNHIGSMYKNKIAMRAVPELLDVLKAAREVINSSSDEGPYFTVSLEDFYFFKSAIDKLDELHGTEVAK